MTNYCSFSITSLAVPWSSVHGKVKFNDHNLCTFTSSSQCLTRPSVCHHTRPEWDLVVINWLLGTMKSPSGSAVLLVESPMCLCMHACVSVCVCVCVCVCVWLLLLLLFLQALMNLLRQTQSPMNTMTDKLIPGWSLPVSNTARDE
jgi:hypothetical protein